MSNEKIPTEMIECPDSGHTGLCFTCPKAHDCPRGYVPRPDDEQTEAARLTAEAVA